MNGLTKLYAGDFNDMIQAWQPDGSVIITLSKRGEDKLYRFKVKDLYGPDEEVVESEEIDTRIPEYLDKRLKEARGIIDNGGS